MATASGHLLAYWNGSDFVDVTSATPLPVTSTPAAGGAGALSSTTARVIPAALGYALIEASASDAPLGATGAAGDYLSHLIIMPATTGAGTVTLKNNTTVIFTFTTGTLADLRPIIVPINAVSTGGSWKVTTGANVSVLAFGNFTA